MVRRILKMSKSEAQEALAGAVAPSEVDRTRGIVALMNMDN